MKIKPYGFRFLVLAGLVFCTVAFTSDAGRSQYSLPIKARSISTADIDLDGDLDVIVGHLTAWQELNKSISILENKNQGIFNISDTAKNFCGYQENIFAIPMDSDEYPDIVTLYSDYSSGTMKRYIRIWYNHTGIYDSCADFTLNSSEVTTDVVYGDINGDGLFDILVLSNLGKRFGVLTNTGSGQLSGPQYYNIPSYYPVDIACGELNNDGRDDVVICGQYVEAYISTTSGFQKIYTDLDGIKNKLAISDFDHDGWNDIIASADLLNTEWTNIYQNTGGNGFNKLENHFLNPGASEISVTDFNNDTLPDIAYLMYSSPGDTSGIKIAYNLGNFQISDPQHVDVPNLGENLRSFHSADLDGNGYNDFAVIRRMAMPVINLELLFNDGEGNFGPDHYVGLKQNPKYKPQLCCYPNPVLCQATFSYSLDKPAHVKLLMYSINGQLLSNLADCKQNPGLHSIPWLKPGNMHGVYIVCLKVDGIITETLKIIIL